MWEYLFLQIRSKSVGDVDVNLICPDDENQLHKDKFIRHKNRIADDHSNSLQITDNIRMVCKYPTYRIFLGLVN